jgi:hypothetical protein
MTAGNDTAAEFLRRAAEAEAQAAKIVEPHLREGFLKVAAEYRRMADQAERLRRPPNR